MVIGKFSFKLFACCKTVLKFHEMTKNYVEPTRSCGERRRRPFLMGNWKSNFIDQVGKENGSQSIEFTDISGTVGWLAG